MSTDLATLTATELEALRAAVDAERVRRWQLDSIPQQIADLNRTYLASEGVELGQPWRQPTGAHDAYPEGFVVTHNGKQWISTIPANVWEPGISGWQQEVMEGEGLPEYVQPTGGHDAYKTGDKVSFEGKCYQSNRDGNVWTPAALPSGWDEIPCP